MLDNTIVRWAPWLHEKIIFILELRAACYGIHAVAGRCKGKLLRVFVDNQGVYYALRSMRSTNFVADQPGYLSVT